jgi:hypothetical protein
MQIRFSRLGRWQKIHLSHIISGLRRLGLLTAQAFKGCQNSPGSIDSNLCFICKIKSFKRDIKLHKIESSERLDSLMSRAKEHNDLMMLKTLNKPDFLASAVYHSGCIRRFLLHSMPLKEETEQSAHEVAFDCLISRISDDLFDCC